jgi:hypothetical protein
MKAGLAPAAGGSASITVDAARTIDITTARVAAQALKARRAGPA